jgi:Fe2+ or Zn2+ uptake regulation protein
MPLTLSSFRIILNTVEQLIGLLRKSGIQPTPQRIEVARYVLYARNHPSAEKVYEQVRRTCPTVSRATVYNTLHLLAEKGLVVARILKEGAVVFDPRVERHHHFVDDETGEVLDIPWDALKIAGTRSLGEFDVREYHVVMRGRRKRSDSSK